MPRHQALYSAPFYPRDFYALPGLWLKDLLKKSELDARELILFHLEPDANLVLFSPEQPLRAWVRGNREQRPLLMTAPTFNRWRRRLLGMESDFQALMRPCSDETGALDAGNRDCYELIDWPDFQNLGVVYRPRNYLANRWPAWLGATWSACAALLGLTALMTERPHVAPDGALQILATRRQVAGAVGRILPQAISRKQVTDGLHILTRLGVVDTVSRTRNNTTYRFSSANLDQPPDFSLERVAKSCQLDLEQNRRWMVLVRVFLLLDCALPEDRALAYWRKLRRYHREVSTDDDIDDLLTLLARRGGHAKSHITTVLRDFVRQRRQDAGRRWVEGERFEQSVNAAATLSPALPMPQPTGHRTHRSATQLVLRCSRGSLTLDEAEQAARELCLSVRQGEQFVVLRSGLLLNKYELNGKVPILLDCNALHTRTDPQRPVQLMIESPRAIPQLRLRAYFRVRFTQSRPS